MANPTVEELYNMQSVFVDHIGMNQFIKRQGLQDGDTYSCRELWHRESDNTTWELIYSMMKNGDSYESSIDKGEYVITQLT